MNRHEMIHAYLFVTANNRDRGSHGPNFKFHMQRINDLTSLNITIYHTFIDEVDHYRTHVNYLKIHTRIHIHTQPNT